MNAGSRVLIASVAWLVPVASIAAPSISAVSGTIASGNSVTISGNGFGSKSQPAPLLWDDFEDRPIGSLIQNTAAAVGQWDTGSGSDNVFYTDARTYAGTRAARHPFSSGKYNSSLSKNGNFPRLYIDFWMNVDYNDVRSRNFKPWRLWGDSDRLDIHYGWDCVNGLMDMFQTGTGWSNTYYGGAHYQDNTWSHYQIVFGQSTPLTPDGTLKHLVNSVPYARSSTAQTTRGNTAQISQIRIGHYWDTASQADIGCAANSGATVYTDNVYIDTSWSRVEIGNAPTYASSTIREIQIPSSWADGSISIKVNTGRYAPGQAVYLYVIDASDVPSAGYPITVDASSTTPKPPSSVVAEYVNYYWRGMALDHGRRSREGAQAIPG